MNVARRRRSTITTRKSSILRVHLGQKWSAHDYSTFFLNIEDVYNLLALLDAQALVREEVRAHVFPCDRRVIRFSAIRIAGLSDIEVIRVEHASPGVSDFLGLGKVLRELNRFFFGSLDRVRDAKKRNLEYDRIKFDLDKARSDQQFAERKRERDEQASEEAHRLDMETKQIANRKFLAETRREEIRLISDQLSLPNSIEAGFRRNELTSDQQLSAVRWLDGRYRPIAKLIDQEKITGVEEMKSQEE